MKIIGLFLAILLYIFNQIEGNQQINNCQIHQIVYSDPNNLSPYIICQECKKNYVVNFDFKSCIKATTFPMATYQFCKRLDRNRYCDEGLCTIQIDQNDVFVSENVYQYDPRCAKIDTINQICISPRYPYTLDIATDKILHQPNRFCKIFHGLRQICLQNYETFYKSDYSDKYFTLINFINSDQIKLGIINRSQLVQCQLNFLYSSPNSGQVIIGGCYPQILNCKEKENGLCKCTDGEAVDSTGSSCQKFENCKVFGYANKIRYCMKCSYGYFKKPYQTDCELRCIEDEVNQICKYCYTDSSGYLYNGEFCEIKNNNKIDPYCLLTNSQTGECVKCADTYFFSLTQGYCLQRGYQSIGCLYFNPIADQCLTLQCASSYQLSDQLANQLWIKIPKDQNSKFDDPQNLILFKHYLNEFFVQPDTVESGYFVYQNNPIQIFNNQVNLTNLNLLSDIYYNNQVNLQICETINNSQVIGCKQYFSGICIQCKSSDIYYIYYGPFFGPQSLRYSFQSYCGYSEDQFISNCKVISNDRTRCLICKESYMLDSNSQCIIGNIENCIYYESQGVCKICKQQYILNSNKCFFISKNCASYNIDSNQNVYCTACKDKNSFYLVYDSQQQRGTCQLLDPLIYEPCKFKIDGQCQECDQNFQEVILNQTYKQCVINLNTLPYFCQYPNNQNLCFQCQNGYLIDQSICYPLQGSCSYYKVQMPPLQPLPQNNCDVNSYLEICQYKNTQGFYLTLLNYSNKFQIQTSCNISSNCFKCYLNICLDSLDTCQKGFGWSQTFNQCFEQCLDDKLLFNKNEKVIDQDQRICNYKRRCDIQKIGNMFQCSDCSLVLTVYECQYLLQSRPICNQDSNYYFQKGQCMYYCGKGKISYDQLSCKYSTLCQDGLTWSDYYNQCIYQQCYNGVIAVDQSCLKQKVFQISIREQLDNYKFTKELIVLVTVDVFLLFLPILFFILLKHAENLNQKAIDSKRNQRKSQKPIPQKISNTKDQKIQTNEEDYQRSLQNDEFIFIPSEEDKATFGGNYQDNFSNLYANQVQDLERNVQQNEQNQINLGLVTQPNQDIGTPNNLQQIQFNRRQNCGSFLNFIQQQN